MATTNKKINTKVDPGIRTTQSTFIDMSSIASSTTINTKVDPQFGSGSKKPLVTTPIANIATITTPGQPDSPVSNVSMTRLINTLVQSYLSTYSGAVGSSYRANIADVANSVAYVNVTGKPSFAAVATSGSYNDLLNVPSLASYATQSYVTTAISNLVDGAPAALDTLKELANSLANNSSYASTITSALAGKVDTSALSSYATTTYVDNKTAWANISGKPALFSGSYADLTNKPTIPEISKTYTAGNLVQNTNLSVQPQEISLTASLDPGIDSFGLAITKVKLDNGAVNISSLDQDFPDIVYKTEINVSYYDGVTITNSPGPNDTKTWIFKNNGQLQLPNGGDIVDSTGTSVLGGGGGASTGNITFSDTTMASTNGNVKIGFSPTASPAVEFKFGTDGNLTLPEGTTISDTSEIVAVTLDQFTDGGYPGTQVFNKVSDTRYEVSPTGPYMELISAIWYLKISVSTYYRSTDLITWEAVAGGTPEPIGTLTRVSTMNLTVGSKVWAFDEDGNITLPGSIIGTNTIEFDNRATGNGADINLYSADDITLQARDRAIGSTSEGGDINIYAGDSAEDGDTSAGDIVIEAGEGGASNIDFGGAGGFVRVEAGQGGAAVGANFSARPGGNLTLRAGNAGDNNGNIDLGNSGGDVIINAGDSTGNGDPGGTIYLTSGAADASGLAGNVVIQAGGTWRFDGNGNLTLPSNTFSVNYANGTQVSIGGGGASTGNVTFNDINIIGDGNLKLQPDSANTSAYLDIFLTAGPDIHIAGNGETVILGTDDFANVAVNVNGNVSIQAGDANGAHTWNFDTTGNLTVPSSLVIGSRPGGGSHIQQNDSALDITGVGSTAGVQLGWAANLSAPDSVALIAMNSIVGEGAGNLVIAVGNNATTVHSWLFGNNGNLKLPAGGDILDSTGNSVLGGGAGGGIALTDLSIGTDGTPTGGGNVSYNNTTGVFTYTPPIIPDVSGFALTSAIPDVSGFVTGTPWTSEGYLTTITNIFNQDLNTTNNVTFSSVITSNVQATNGSPAVASPVAVGGAGAPLTIGAGDGGIAATGVNAGAGGNLTITAGDAGSDIGNPSWGEIGGTLVIRGGNSSRPYHGSDVQIHSGNSVISPGAISLYTGTNQWTFGKDGTTTLANNATIISPLTGLTVRVTGQYNICTVVNPGSGYEAGNSTSLVTGGSGTGMVVGYGYGLSGQIVSVGVTTAGTGYQDGDVLTMTAGDGTATFVITKYNSSANPNTNTAPSDWIFDTTNNITLPLGGDIKDSTGTSVLFSGDYTDLTNQPTIPAAQIQSDWTQATNTALDYIKNKPTILAEPAFTVKTTDFNATAGSRYGFDTTAGVVTATLPASPAAGDAIYFADASGTTSTNNFIIARNGGTIMSSASDMTTNTNDQSFGLFYNGTTWRVY